ncbi:homoserine/homoserine lactone efflux protein [Leucobacter komagatae]|uniref:Homoserine/homoserine lactone efflux protein n=1 Tax=Leucobacter komagatae TaxID=55969 RepID=A0A542Y6R8_9MICO|nr:LysE family transporter [Leucobacter komagatae]TQL43735.1 homoserine/homoserine lactone efflux protein [Leucobacter komagatae]
MSFSLWLSLLTACIVISFTPGAGAINTMSNALASGWRRSIWGIVGQVVALIVHIVIVAAGVGVFVAKSPALFAGIRYAGAAYLIYLGVRMALTKPAPATAGDVVVVPHVTNRAMLLRGLWVNLLNPKAIVFFLAFIPQFVRLDQPQLPQYVILGATAVVVDVLVMWFFYAAAAKPFGRFASTVRGQRVLNTVFGALFVLVAAVLLVIH